MPINPISQLMAKARNNLTKEYPGAMITRRGNDLVIKETIGKDLPDKFQTAEFVKDHGFLDLIIERKNLKEKLSQLIRIYNS